MITIRKIYKIANLFFQIESSFEYPLYKEGLPFVEDCKTPDIIFKFQKIQSFRDFLHDEVIVYSNALYHVINVDDKEYRGFHQYGYLYALVYIDNNIGYCYYEDETFLLNKMCSGPRDFTFLCLEKHLINNGAIIIHSSYIQYNNDGIVFSAPSGTGKSTHAYLWEKYKDAKVINGDRSILMKNNDLWYVHGIPMNGTSKISLNISLPLKAIIILRQDSYNHVEKIDVLNKFKYIYSEVTVNRWNSSQVQKAIKIIDDLINDIPIFMLFCNKEKTAVECIYEVLYENN